MKSYFAFPPEGAVGSTAVPFPGVLPNKTHLIAPSGGCAFVAADG